MILRVRLPSGATTRIDAPPYSSLAAIAALIEALPQISGQFSLFSDPTFAHQFDPLNASQGDIIFVRGQRPSESPSENTASKPEKKLSPRCAERHGPRGMCELCMPKEDKQERYEKELARWEGKKGTSAAVMAAKEALKVRVKVQEEGTVKVASVDQETGTRFQMYLSKTGGGQQRLGFCYGEKGEEEGETKILAIYEPPQKGGEEMWDLVEGEEGGDMNKRAAKVAELMGLERVGLILSARPRKCILSGRDVVFAAKIISELSEEERKAFVVLVVGMNEAGEAVVEAYQLSDLAVEMYEKGVFEDLEKQKPNGGKVYCKEDVIVEGKDVRKVHTEFFLISVAIRICEGWVRTKFGIENRDVEPQGVHDIRNILRDENVPYYKRLMDFHALLFLSNTFDIQSDMPALITAIKEESDEIGEGFRLMIDGMAAA